MVKWLAPFIEFGVVKAHHVSMLAMAEIAAVNWMHIISQVRSQFDLLWNTYCVIVESYNTAFLAPVIWIMLLLSLFWFRPSVVAPPDKDDDNVEHMTRAYHRALEADARRRRRFSMKRQVCGQHPHPWTPSTMLSFGPSSHGVFHSRLQSDH